MVRGALDQSAAFRIGLMQEACAGHLEAPGQAASSAPLRPPLLRGRRPFDAVAMLSPSASGTRGSSPCHRHSNGGCAAPPRCRPGNARRNGTARSAGRGRGRCSRVPRRGLEFRLARRRPERARPRWWSRSKRGVWFPVCAERVSRRGNGNAGTRGNAPRACGGTAGNRPAIRTRRPRRSSSGSSGGPSGATQHRPRTCVPFRGHRITVSTWRTSSPARPASSAAISSSACSHAASASTCWCGRGRWRSSRRSRNSGAHAPSRVVPVAGDLAEPNLGVSKADLRQAHRQGRAPVPPRGGVRPAGDERGAGDGEHRRHRPRAAVRRQRAGGLLPPRELDRGRRTYKGSFRENMFEEATGLDHPYFRTKHESEALVRNRCKRPWRVYRPGIVVGHSQTGQIDKIDGPYYFFKMIQKLRQSLPPWFPLIGLEGGYINLVPVDYVAAAMDHLAHVPGPGRPVLPPDRPAPAPRRRSTESFRALRHAPTMAFRLDPKLLDLIPAGVTGVAGELPAAAAGRRHDPAGPPHPARRHAVLQLADALRLHAHAAPARRHRHRVPSLEDYAWRLWDYWERHLDPDLSLDRSLAGAVRGKVVLITGGSSGIGLAAAERCVGRGRQGADRRPRSREARGGAPRSSPRTAAAVPPTPATSPTTPPAMRFAKQSARRTWRRGRAGQQRRAARSAARSTCPMIASTISSARCNSTTSRSCA